MRFKLLTFSFLLILSVLALTLFMLRFYPAKYNGAISKNAEKFGLDAAVVYAVIKTESNFDPTALSVKGAKGLMQIMDKTGEWGFIELGKTGEYTPQLLFDPELNIEIGCWYLNKLIDQYKNIETALAAYNAGSGNVSGWLKNPDYSNGATLHNIPFKETRNYIQRVRKNKKIYEFLRGKGG